MSINSASDPIAYSILLSMNPLHEELKKARKQLKAYKNVLEQIEEGKSDFTSQARSKVSSDISALQAKIRTLKEQAMRMDQYIESYLLSTNTTIIHFPKTEKE